MYKKVSRGTTSLIYKNIIKSILFQVDPEKVHDVTTKFAELTGKNKVLKNILHNSYVYSNPALEQTIAGITFKNPVGLSAGFDYEARLTQILSHVGFGFQTVGTITNHAYDGNPRPMLGRLPKSKSLMVNKGFKNLGEKETIKKMQRLSFAIPVGISIGRTNSEKCSTQVLSIEDIIKTFTAFEKSKVAHSYYELNISCPNLYGNVTFYPPKNLKELLREVDKLHIKKPIFIKMPIEKSDAEVLAMLKVIAASSAKGIIIGNLQKDRKDKAFDRKEVMKFRVGNFSGKPTHRRSNELISLAYKRYADRFTIIGCGGVFSAMDAYEKITRGASLIQLITGMIYQGPQIISQINYDLVKIVKKNGFTNIHEAIGSKNF